MTTIELHFIFTETTLSTLLYFVVGGQFPKSRVQVMPAGNVSLAAITQASQISLASVSSRPPLPIVSISGNAGQHHTTVTGVTMTSTPVSSAASIPIGQYKLFL